MIRDLDEQVSAAKVHAAEMNLAEANLREENNQVRSLLAAETEAVTNIKVWVQHFAAAVRTRNWSCELGG